MLRFSGMFPLLVFLVPALLLTAASARAQLVRDIEFARPGGVSLTLDAYVPLGKGPHPAVIVVHGGGFEAGDKQTYVKPLFEPLMRAGFAWFSINYRLAPQHPFPAATGDVAAAVAWLRQHAGQYRVDARRIALMGESAGGHLVSYAGARIRGQQRVAAVVSFYGLHDLEARERSRGELSRNLRQFLALTEWNDEATRKLREASPISYVHGAMPPYLMIHGTADTAVPFDQSVRMCDAMKAAGNRCEVYPVQDGGHGVENWEKDHTFHHYKAKMVEWLNATLKN